MKPQYADGSMCSVAKTLREESSESPQIRDPKLSSQMDLGENISIMEQKSIPVKINYKANRSRTTDNMAVRLKPFKTFQSKPSNIQSIIEQR